MQVAAHAMGPFYLHGLTLILAWMNDYAHYKTYLFIHEIQRCSRWSLRTRRTNFILHFTWPVITSHAGIKVNPC